MNLQKKFETPILLIVWKRPEKTLRIIKEIQKIKPNDFYIACDGYPENNILLEQKVQKTRKVILENINWNCNIKKLFAENNQGCKEGVSNAISWFFENVNEGIILEDDCLPHQDFFYFCSELLHKYRNDDRIWSITGNNKHNLNIEGKSYFFSKYSNSWGWATWKRCWNKYDKDIKNWPIEKSKGIINQIFEDKNEQRFWKQTLDNIYYHMKPNTWDYQWNYTCFIYSGLTIIPSHNLINNIGFDLEATHTKFEKPIKELESYERYSSGVFPLKHPDYIHDMKNIDKYTDAICYSGGKIFSKLWFQVILIKFRIKAKIIISKLKRKLS